MKFGKFLMSPTDIGITRKLRHQAAMLLPFPMIDMIVVTHRVRPRLVQAAASLGGHRARWRPSFGAVRNATPVKKTQCDPGKGYTIGELGAPNSADFRCSKART